ncbi:hypothetical protein M426DRAFT_258556 [Hypoxylon sp. CI-4A]|nr:hypothetical protein M426DRAFT_258556 [Hypoxylon sp. CI-4A]
MAPANLNPNFSLGNVLEGPAAPPPDGTLSDFNNPPNKNGLVRAVLILLLTITILFVLVRVYSRLILKKITISDVLGIAAFALYVSFVCLFFKLADSYGWFVHMWDLQLKNFPAVNQLFYQGLLIYFAIVVLIKSAIVLEWIAIFVPDRTRNFFFWSSCSVLVIHNLFYIAIIILELAACSPFERNWNPLIEGKCLDTIDLAVAVSAINVTLDVLIFLLPQKVIWGLQMRNQRKIGISLLFAVGILACVAAGFRLSASLQFSKSRDTSYTFAGLALWCLAEVTCGFIVLCGPSAPKTIAHLEIQQLASSLKSWAGSSVRKLTSSGNSSRGSVFTVTHKRSKSSLSQNGRRPRKDDTIPIVPKIPVAHDSSSSLMQPEHNIQNSDAAIFRTTQFVATEGQRSSNISQDEYNRQHPWVSNEKVA